MNRNCNSLQNSFNKSAEIYDNETETFHNKISEYITKENLLLELPLDKNINILDSGGGTGKFSIYLYEQGYNVTLSDISQDSLNEAIKKAKGMSFKTHLCNSEETPFKNNSFDFIMMNGGVISYTPKPDKLLKEAFRILKPNGILFFDFFNSVGWAIETLDPDSKVHLASKMDHLIQMDDWDYSARVFSLQKIRNLLKENNFKIKSEYGLILLSNSLPLKIRYSKEFDTDLLEKYKDIELELSRKAECIGASWSCTICAIKM